MADDATEHPHVAAGSAADVNLETAPASVRGGFWFTMLKFLSSADVHRCLLYKQKSTHLAAPLNPKNQGVNVASPKSTCVLPVTQHGVS